MTKKSHTKTYSRQWLLSQLTGDNTYSFKSPSYRAALLSILAAVSDNTREDFYSSQLDRYAKRLGWDLEKHRTFDNKKIDYETGRPKSINDQLKLAKGIMPNDFLSYLEHPCHHKISYKSTRISIIIPTFNRSERLQKTVAAICAESKNIDLKTELIVVDDGGDECIRSDIEFANNYVELLLARQPRKGYRPASARNLGAKIASGELLFFLDSDIIIPKGYLKEHISAAELSDRFVTLGFRRFIDGTSMRLEDILTGQLNHELLDDCKSKNTRFTKSNSYSTDPTYDWRFEILAATEGLIASTNPYLCLGGGHFGISRKLFLESGGFDEEFSSWGGEDIELGYRLYNLGAFFVPVLSKLDLHLEEPVHNEVDRDSGMRSSYPTLKRKCPDTSLYGGERNVADFRLKAYQQTEKQAVPLVSIYIPVLNRQFTISKCIESAINQDMQDFEIIICDNGSTDSTLNIIKEYTKKDERIQLVHESQKGISHASNKALSHCKGMYIAQLDSDDELLPEALSTCIEHMKKSTASLIYTKSIHINKITDTSEDGYFDTFNQYCQLLGNMVGHLRFYRRRVLADPRVRFDTSMSNSVDYDFYSQICLKWHCEGLPKSLYQYNINSTSTSINNRFIQRENHINVISRNLARLGLDKCYKAIKPFPSRPLEIQITPIDYDPGKEWVPIPAEVASLIPSSGRGNDYSEIKHIAENIKSEGRLPSLPISIVIPVYNRKERLAKTLAGLVNQSYPNHLMEVIVADDGSSDGVEDVIHLFESKLNIKHVWQPDRGFRLASVRNLGLNAATHNAIVGLDCDLIPTRDFVLSFSYYLQASRNVLCLGLYKFIDANHINYDDILKNPSIIDAFEEIQTENKAVGGDKGNNGATRDWRLSVYDETDLLLNDKYPHRAVSGGQLAFWKDKYLEAGGYDEDFTSWGCEDNLFAYHMQNKGCYIIPVLDAIDLHQEPPGKENETDRIKAWEITRPLLQKKAPDYRGWFGNPWVHMEDESPKVSIYIPALNVSRYICDAIESCLSQDYESYEVCVLDTGSSDGTYDLIKSRYGREPKVRLYKKLCSTVCDARYHAIRLCRGKYIGQLDGDDRLLPGAIRKLSNLLDGSDSLSMVYSKYQKISENGHLIGEGWNSGPFIKDRLLTVMCVQHFRMFRARDWFRSGEYSKDERNKFTYAEDFLQALKLMMVGELANLDEVLYEYRIRENGNASSNHDDSLKSLLTIEAAYSALADTPVSKLYYIAQAYPDIPGLLAYSRKGLSI